MIFTPATRRRSRARVALTGPSGSGKTYSALLLAKGLGGTIAVVDTEHGSADLYADTPGMPEYSTLSLGPPYSPEAFIDAAKQAAAAGFDTLVIDSLTHEWNGPGGCLELADTLGATKYRGNTWSAWSEVGPRHRAMMDALLRYPGHLIVTTRSKTETEQQKDDRGKVRVVKLGMKPEQREGIEYEFTTVFDLSHDGHFAVTSKDRTGLFAGDPHLITPETGERLRRWMEEAQEAPTLTDDVIHTLCKTIADSKTRQEMDAAHAAAVAQAEAIGDTAALSAFHTARGERIAIARASKDSAP